MLITLFLIEKGVLTTPALYISYYLKKNRIEYYDRLSEVRSKGNYEQWIKFFLQAIEESAADATTAIDQLTALHNQNISKIEALDRSTKTVRKLYDYLEANPIIEIKKTAASLDVSFNTIAKAIGSLIEIGILAQTGNASRNRTFAYTSYLEILRKGT